MALALDLLSGPASPPHPPKQVDHPQSPFHGDSGWELMDPSPALWEEEQLSRWQPPPLCADGYLLHDLWPLLHNMIL